MKMKKKHILSHLVNRTPMLCSDEYLLSAIMAEGKSAPDDEKTWMEALLKNEMYPSFKQVQHQKCEIIRAISEDIHISDEYDSPDVRDSLAYYAIHGLILAESYWYFSTKQFVNDLITAEQNPNIIGHFLHISSGGGEAWFLDRASEALNQCQKPIYVFIEKAACSAAYYIGCHGDVVKCSTQNDIVGSIGVMVDFYNFDKYFEKLGIERITEYATKSNLKNKKFKDLVEGKPEQYIKEELDPLQIQFENEVRANRPIIAELPEDDPVVRGETYLAAASIEQGKGLVDGLATFQEALEEAYQLAATNTKNEKLKTLLQ